MIYINIALYIILFGFHVFMSFSKSKCCNRKFLAIITFLFLFCLMCGYKYAGPNDSGDFLQYLNDYQLQEMRNYWLHYLFYFLIKIGYLLGLNFYQWWALMTALTLFLLWRYIKIFVLDVNYALLIFMSYYVFMLYPGLKFLYGFVFLFIGTGYLLRGKRLDRLRFLLSILIASGIHFMYYLFIILIFTKRTSKSNKLVRWIVAVSLILSIIVLLSGRNIPFLNELASLVEDNKVNYYLQSRTENGFFIPVAIHLLTLIYSIIFNRIIQNNNSPQIDDNARKWSSLLFYSNLLQVVFYPLFMLALTFMRLITAFSLTTLLMSSRYMRFMSIKEKRKLYMWALILVLAFWVINIFIVDYMDYVLIQFFDSYITKLDFYP